MNDHPMVMALHAAISRRSWHDVEQAANKIRDNRNIRWPFECAGRTQALPEPSGCNWPDCGCDPYATKVIESLVEQGWTTPSRPDAGGGVVAQHIAIERIDSAYDEWRRTLTILDKPTNHDAFSQGYVAGWNVKEATLSNPPSNPPAVVESNASAEARLREALEGGLPDWDDFLGIAPNATGDLSSEAFIREQRDSWDDKYSDPSPDRREIVARIINPTAWAITPEVYGLKSQDQLETQTQVGVERRLALEKADAILAALNGGAGA